MQHSHGSSNHTSPSDEDLLAAVREAISRSEPLRASAMENLDVEVSHGRVVLKGFVATYAHKLQAEQLAHTVQGVIEVDNRLLTNEALERQIALALASDELTSDLRIAVRVVGKIASLYGAVGTQEESERAGRVASSVAEGIGIHNRLHVLPTGQPALLLWQQSVEGRQAEKELMAKLESASQDTPEESSNAAPANVPPGAAAEGIA